MFGQLLSIARFATAFQAQRRILRDFHRRCARVLEGSCGLKPYEPDVLHIKRNFFSTLFLAALRCAGLPPERTHFYGLINQCMRAWVTACDNLLDDEFKSVIPFDLPEGGHRFQSVLTIMAADRVFFDLVCEEMGEGRLAPRQAMELGHLTLRALVPSGLQEHEEELGAPIVLPPDELLETIHVPKTGLLFEAPLVAPERLGEIGGWRAAATKAALRSFGLACQVLDDIVDFERDLAQRRHNLFLSVAAHSNGFTPPITHADIVDVASLPLDIALERTCQRSVDLFRSAHRGLADVGLRIGDRPWRVLVAAIARQLKVPEKAQRILEGAL